MGFQKFVNTQPAPGEAGDFAGTNPRMSLAAPAGGYKAGPDGVIVGRFAWADYDTGLVTNVKGALVLLGFIHRENQALITEFLAEATYTIPEGFMVTLMSRGDFWADFPAGADVGDLVYADPLTGLPTVTAGGNTLTPFKVASPAIANAVSNAATTIDVDTGVMTVAAMASGLFEVGQRLTWAGLDPNNRVTITRILTGAGAAGTYQTTYLNRPAVGATTVTGSQGTLAKITSWQ